MRTVNVREARARLGSLLDAVERGEEIVIRRHGRPIARLVAVEPDRRQVRFPDRSELRRRLPPCRESTAATVRALRDDGCF